LNANAINERLGALIDDDPHEQRLSACRVAAQGLLPGHHLGRGKATACVQHFNASNIFVKHRFGESRTLAANASQLVKALTSNRRFCDIDASVRF
jgi:hypothetical protein